jgi:hypothetical protein
LISQPLRLFDHSREGTIRSSNRIGGVLYLENVEKR